MDVESAALTYAVDTGPEGPEVGALFDLDGTLVAGFSVVAFARDRLASGELTLQDVADITLNGISFQRGGLGFSGIMAALARMLRGTPEQEMIETGQRLCDEQLAGLLHEEARTLVEAHRKRGHTLAIASAATRYQVEPFARELGIPNIVCTELEVKGGRLTGRVKPPPCWGEGKLEGARRLAGQQGFDLGKSYFYSDGYEDIPLLEAVGLPRPTNPDRNLDQLARRRAWPVLRFGQPDPATRLEHARSLLALSLLPNVALASTAAALISDRLRGPLNLCVGGLSQVLTRIAGLELRVANRVHLESSRPAVYLFNHQSALDSLIVGQLLRRDFAPLVRRQSPESRLLAQLGETAFVAEPTSAQDLAPALRTLERGISIVAAPEIGRTPSPRLAPFREMPFRIAAQARVALVPIVIHDSAKALPRGSLVVRSRPIHITVLGPVETKSWGKGSLGPHIAAMHARYAATLERSAGERGDDL